MKWVVSLVIVLLLGACSTSQKYSNSRYQRQNNTDDAYFSPGDVKKNTTAKPEAVKAEDEEEQLEQYQSNSSYYDNTHDETANPNADQRGTNYQQYSQNNNSANIVAPPSNPNSLQGAPQYNITNNYYGGSYFGRRPYSPMFYPWMSNPGMSFSYNTWNNSWYIGPTYNQGWGYNNWNAGYNPYDPWGWNNNYWGYNHGWGYNNWNNPWNNNFVYDPWMNTWVYMPFSYNSWGYNPYNPYMGYNPYSPYSPWGYNHYDPFWSNGGNNGGTVSNTVNTRRRPTNSFMPATQTAGANGGSRIVGRTERIEQPATGTNPTPTNNTPQTGGTYARGDVTTTPPAPTNTGTRSQPDYRTYPTGSNSPSTPSTNTTPAPTNYNPSPGGGTYGNGNAGTTPSRNNNTPTNVQPAPQMPTQQRYTPQPTNNTPRDVFAPQNTGGNNGGSNRSGGNIGGGGGGSNGGGGGRRR